MRPIAYNIRDFSWSKQDRTFFGHLYSLVPVDDIYDDDLSNQKDPFWIKNFETGNSRLFTYVGEDDCYWIFVSECGILCKIVIDSEFSFKFLFNEKTAEALEAVC